MIGEKRFGVELQTSRQTNPRLKNAEITPNQKSFSKKQAKFHPRMRTSIPDSDIYGLSPDLGSLLKKIDGDVCRFFVEKMHTITQGDGRPTKRLVSLSEDLESLVITVSDSKRFSQHKTKTSQENFAAVSNQAFNKKFHRNRTNSLENLHMLNMNMNSDHHRNQYNGRKLFEKTRLPVQQQPPQRRSLNLQAGAISRKPRPKSDFYADKYPLPEGGNKFRNSKKHNNRKNPESGVISHTSDYNSASITDSESFNQRLRVAEAADLNSNSGFADLEDFEDLRFKVDLENFIVDQPISGNAILSKPLSSNWVDNVMLFDNKNSRKTIQKVKKPLLIVDPSDPSKEETPLEETAKEDDN